jgi:hypothetical protein
LKNTFVFTREVLKCVLSAKAGPCIAPNELSLYRAKFCTECPYSNQRRIVSFYFRQVNGKPPSDPKCAQDVTDTISKTNQLQRGYIRLGRNIEDQDLAATGVEGDRSAAGTVNTITPKRKVRTNDHGCAAAAASAITPGNDDDQVNEIGFLVGSLEIVGECSKDQDDKKSNDITHNRIENMQKLFRTHCAALDFDKGFIFASLKSGKDFDLKQEVEIGPRKKKRGSKEQE